ncbi:MAG: hypothetical protein L0177_15580, partial [Chloroflexi bacterium]|nr:hypothetical protein [Chloroflexota bacterium]
MSERSNQEVEVLFSLVRERYGGRLNADELEEVRKGVEGVVEMAQALRSQRLQNGDEPFSIF